MSHPNTELALVQSQSCDEKYPAGICQFQQVEHSTSATTQLILMTQSSVAGSSGHLICSVINLEFTLDGNTVH